MSENSLQTGGLLSLTVTDLTVDGGALARHEGKVVFLDRGLPGEMLTAQITEVKGRVTRARVVETLQPSPHAVLPWCPHFSLCGGCSLQDMEATALLAWKESHVRQTLARIGKSPDLPVAPVAPSPLSREYRNKMSHAFGRGPAGETLLGLRRRGAHDIVEVSQCRMQPPVSMDILGAFRSEIKTQEFNAWNEQPGLLRHLVIRTPTALQNGKPQVHVECITSPEGEKPANAKALEKLGSKLLDECGVSGFAHSIRAAVAEVAQGEHIIHICGESVLEEQIGEIVLQSPFWAFMQTNTAAAEILYAKVAECAALTGTETVWDLYCGVGGIGLSLAEKAGAVYGFEIERDAVKAAKLNSRDLGFSHCRFTSGDLAQTLVRQESHPDVIIADPPRAGMDERVCEILAQIPARMLIYVSCDVGTQARDLTRLAPFWRPVTAYPVDMFPHTMHVENIVVLQRQP